MGVGDFLCAVGVEDGLELFDAFLVEEMFRPVGEEIVGVDWAAALGAAGGVGVEGEGVAAAWAGEVSGVDGAFGFESLTEYVDEDEEVGEEVGGDERDESDGFCAFGGVLGDPAQQEECDDEGRKNKQDVSQARGSAVAVFVLGGCHPRRWLQAVVTSSRVILLIMSAARSSRK